MNIPHPMLMSIQGPNGPRMSYIPAVHPFAFPPYTANTFPPLNQNGVMMGHCNSDCSPQARKLFIGGLSHETTDEQVLFTSDGII